MTAYQLALAPDAAAAPKPLGVIALDPRNRAYVARVLFQGADQGLQMLIGQINAGPLELPDPTIGAPNMPMTGIMTFDPSEPEFAEALKLWLELKGYHVTTVSEPVQ